MSAFQIEKMFDDNGPRFEFLPEGNDNNHGIDFGRMVGEEEDTAFSIQVFLSQRLQPLNPDAIPNAQERFRQPIRDPHEDCPYKHHNFPAW
jgi:hypothetical protein